MTTELAAPVQALTGRQNETLLLVACGLTNAEIGRHIGLTEAAVKSRVKDLFAALGGSTSRVDAVFDAIDQGHVTFSEVQAARAEFAGGR